MTNNTNNQNNSTTTINVNIDTLFDNSGKYAKIPITKGKSLCLSIFALSAGILLIMISIFMAHDIGQSKMTFVEFMSNLLILTTYGSLSIVILQFGYRNMLYRIRYRQVVKKAKKSGKSIQECYVETIAAWKEIPKETAYKALMRKGKYVRLQEKIDIYYNVDL